MPIALARCLSVFNSWWRTGFTLLLVIGLCGQLAQAQILGANFNENARNADAALFAASSTTWARGFFDVLQMRNNNSLATQADVVGMRRAADAGQQLLLSLKWNFSGQGQQVPAPGSADEQFLFGRALATINAVGRPINGIVLGNEPMWETPTADLTFSGGSVPLVTFTERLLTYLQTEYQPITGPAPRYHLGALNRLDQSANQNKDVVQELLRVARDNPAIAGLDIHVHFDTAAQARSMVQYARTQLGLTKDLLVTEFSPVWQYQAHLGDAIGATPAGTQFAQQYGYAPTLPVDEYLTMAFADQVTRGEWTDFIESQPWFNTNHIADMHALFREFDVSVATLGFSQGLNMRGLDATRPGWAPYQINWLYIAGLIEGTNLVEGYNEPYMKDWLTVQTALADFDRNGTLTLADYNHLQANQALDVQALTNVQALLAGDMNLDRVIDQRDFDLFHAAYTRSHSGPLESSDFNGDGTLDTHDITIFAQHWLTENSLAPAEAFAQGDRNGDGINNLADWVLIRQDFLLSGAGAALSAAPFDGAVPEPAARITLSALAIATLAFARRYKITA